MLMADTDGESTLTAKDLYLHDGLWCVRCNCGEYVPICAEEGEDECPQCGRRYAVRVVRR